MYKALYICSSFLVKMDEGNDLENSGIDGDESLMSSPIRRQAPPALFNTSGDGMAKELIDLSAVALKEAQGASNKVLADLLQAKPRPGDVKAWIRSLETNETERAMLERSLISFGSIENLANDQKHLDRENKKLRFREQRFSHEPLLRRRRLDMLPPQLLKVMVVSLQNELASANENLEKCRVAEHPLLRDKLPPTKNILMQDLQRILASGVGETTPFRASVSDLSDRQRDLMLDSLRNQNRLLRSQIMRLQACLNGLPGSGKTVLAGPEGSPRISANGIGGIGCPSPTRMNSSNGDVLQGTMVSPQHNSSPKQHRFRLMEERIHQCNAEIDRLQKELFKTQEDLRRSESTIDAQLEIEAKMIEEKARLSRQNLQLGTFTLRVLEDSHPKLAAQILRGKSLRGWYKVMQEGEDFDEEAWAIEREGIVGSEEPEEQVYRETNRKKSEGQGDGGSEANGTNSRPSTSQTNHSDGDANHSSSIKNVRSSKKHPILTPGNKKPARPQSSSKYKHSRSSRSNKDSRKSKPSNVDSRSKKQKSKKRSNERKPRKKEDGMFQLPLKDLTLGTRRGSTSQSPSISARSDKALTKPVFNVDDVPASARLLRLSIGPDEEEKSEAVVKSEKNNDILPADVAEAISPIVFRFDRVLRQIFTHFARTQNKPIGSRDLFAEIAKWTSTLTHASFFKVLKHFKVVPRLCTKKDAFTLLIGTNRKISYAEFLARLVDISHLCMKRLYVLADANSIQYLEKCFLVICRKLGLLKKFEGGIGPKGEEEEDAEDSEKYDEKSLVLLTKPPPSIMLGLNDFVKYASEEDKILLSLFPGDSLNLLNAGKEDAKMSWPDMKSYWWKNCSNSRTPGIIQKRDTDNYASDMPPEFSNPNTSPPRVVSGSRRRRQLASMRDGTAGLANPENQAKAFELLCNFMVQTEVNITE